MGTETSSNDEWIELYNNLSSSIDVNGWKLTTEDGTPIIILKGKIPSKGFFLLERTDDTTLNNIKATLIYKGSLNNGGEYLKLMNFEGKMVDKINCSSGWFGGNNKTKRTMERKNSLISGDDPKNWQTSQDIGGTPKIKNSKGKREENEEKSVIPKDSANLKNSALSKSSAIIGEQVPESPNKFFVFLIAFFVAVSSGIFILILKRKM